MLNAAKSLFYLPIPPSRSSISSGVASPSVGSGVRSHRRAFARSPNTSIARAITSTISPIPTISASCDRCIRATSGSPTRTPIKLPAASAVGCGSDASPYTPSSVVRPHPQPVGVPAFLSGKAGSMPFADFSLTDDYSISPGTPERYPGSCDKACSFSSLRRSSPPPRVSGPRIRSSNSIGMA